MYFITYTLLHYP